VKKDRKYILYLVAAFILYVGIKLFSPATINWTVSYHREDTNPFGSYALSEAIDGLFPGKRIHQTNQTLYELYDSVKTPVNFISFSTHFKPGREDVEALLRNIEIGGCAFIAAQYFYGSDFADTLNLDTDDYFFNSGNSYINRNDTAAIKFVNPLLPGDDYNFPRKNTSIYFSSFDSTRTSVVAKNSFGQPVLIRIQWGKGDIIVSSTPLAFTNIYLLRDNHGGFAEAALSFLPVQSVYWTEFYHTGRMESDSFLRFVLKTEPLRWAYAVAMLSILTYMIFEAKRKQRIIPVIKPLTNTTLEFVQTIGNLYYQNSEHKNIAEKKINFFLEQIRTKYWVSTIHFDDGFYYTLARKSAHTLEDVKDLFKLIKYIQTSASITADELVELNRKIETFNT
jgi:hypothetical protein